MKHEDIDNAEIHCYLSGDRKDLKGILSFYGSHVSNADGQEAYYLPYWWEPVGDDKFEQHHLGSLPDWLKDCIHDLRGTSEMLHKGGALMEQLKDFLDFLLQAGYCDSDVYDEPPTAIDRYMKTK